METLTFRGACEIVAAADKTKFTNSEKRLMYALYKIATVGSGPNVRRPSFVSGKQEYWDAWQKYGNKITQEEAKERYIQFVAARIS